MKIAQITLNRFNKAAGIKIDIFDPETLKWMILIEFIIILFLGYKLMRSSCIIFDLIDSKLKKNRNPNEEMIINLEYKKPNNPKLYSTKKLFTSKERTLKSYSN